MKWETLQPLKITQMAAMSRSDLHFGPAQNEHPCGPNLRSLAPLGQLSARSTGPPSKKKPPGQRSMSSPVIDQFFAY